MGNACSGDAAENAGFCCPCDAEPPQKQPSEPAVYLPAQLESIEDAAQARARRRPPPMEKLPHDKWCHVANIPLFLPARKVERMPPGVMQLVHGAGLGLAVTVTRSLDHKVHVDAPDPMGWSALHKVWLGHHAALALIPECACGFSST